MKSIDLIADRLKNSSSIAKAYLDQKEEIRRLKEFCRNELGVDPNAPIDDNIREN